MEDVRRYPGLFHDYRTMEERPRKRREAYVQNACSTCKRRKTRCNGQTPCQLCTRRSTECSYTGEGVRTTREHGSTQQTVGHLTEVVSRLQNALDELLEKRSNDSKAAPDQRRNSPSEGRAESSETLRTTPLELEDVSDETRRSPTNEPLPLSRLSGPSSSQFGFRAAMTLLQSTSRDTTVAGADLDTAKSLIANGEFTMQRNFSTPQELLWHVGYTKAVHLVDIYQDVIGQLYPIANLDQIRHILLTLIGDEREPLAESLNASEMNVTVLVLAIALLNEGLEEECLAEDFVASVQDSVRSVVFANDPCIDDLVALLLLAMYHFLRDVLRLASRTVAMAARLALEFGLNRREIIKTTISGKESQERAETVVWSIFVLDRVFSFPAGLPPHFSDDIIDLPKPANLPYLRAMIPYVSFGYQIWKDVWDRQGRVAKFDPDSAERLDARLMSWQASLPIDIRTAQCQCGNSRLSEEDRTGSTAGNYIRTLLRLRTNQLRIMVRRPLLCAPDGFVTYKEHVNQLLSAAIDSVRLLGDLNSLGDEYCRLQVIFHHFLCSALSAFMLILAHQSQLKSTSELSSFSEPVNTDISITTVATEGISTVFSLIHSYSTRKSSARRLRSKLRPYHRVLLKRGLLQLSDSEPDMDHSPAGSYLDLDTDGFQQLIEHSNLGGLFDVPWSFEDLFTSVKSASTARW
ncbi:hypothetical protein OIDMADRAFT_185085 [Oidiodendron maius Zn]|uniref:Zn(2)-C6 fungal-type domain-containing protein n=1 Tax=Oidiodendron maius (strain Zn) TaxID=913774 RepID=A0A0C3C1F1_OIDMZ|nr:hypothetical protein OIDMADRAFT_185085 [Oidiodendron maius Zn]